MNQHLALQQSRTRKAPLYRHVFYGRFSFVVVFVLLCSILLQPIDRARASEGDTPVAPAPIDTSVVSSVPPPPAPVSQTPITVDTPVTPVPTVTATPPDSLASHTTSADIPVPQEATDSIQNATTTENLASLATSSIETDVSGSAEATSSVIQTSTTPIELQTPDVSTSTTALDAPAVVTTHTSSTKEIVTATDTTALPATSTGEVLEAKATLLSDSQIQFDKSDCVAVADGSYYCKTKTAAPASDVKDGLYSKPDVDGDLEIYFARNGVLEQITHNQVDDASPYYDSISNTIVWHRLINDRYQIISYDITSGAESQLTTDTVNNMEPTRAGKYTAWQHWNKDNWDIMLFDGATTKLLTTVPEHDIAPKIRSNLVMWNRLSHDNTQSIELYDLTTGEYTSIADDEGGELSNPRMVLVYDAQFKNGDVVTKGYDVVTGNISPLSGLPVKIPDNIPAPDKTGETRAFIQMKTSSREDAELGTTTPTIDPPVPDTGSATPQSALTLNVQSVTEATSSVVASTTNSLLTLDLTASSTFQLTELDVVIPAFTAPTTSVTTTEVVP